MSLDDLIQMAHHPTSSRVLDAVLESETVPKTAKRKFVMTFIGHYHVLVDDRIGSRVGDRCWASADPYLKVCVPHILSFIVRPQPNLSRRAYGQQEKIARSLIPHEHALAGSFYGKFFARNLNLHVLQRDPERWKSLQAAAKQPPASTSNATTTTTRQPHPNPHAAAGANPPGQKTASVAEPVTPRGTDAEADKGGGGAGRRKASSAKASRPQDEIDALFDATLGKKVKKAELASADKTGTGDKVESPSKSKSKAKGEKDGDKKSRKRKKGEEGAVEDRDLSDVLGAIRSAPKEDKGPKRKRAH